MAEMQLNVNAKYKKCRSIADGAFFEAGAKEANHEKGVTSKLAREITAANSKLCSAYVGNQKKRTGSKNAPESHTSEWVLDNLYMIEAEVKECTANLKRIENVIAHNGKPLVYTAARLYLQRLETAFDDAACTAFADAFFESGIEISGEDMYSLALIMRAAILGLVFDIAENESGKKVVNLTDDNMRAAAIGKCISSLKYISYHKFEKSFAKSDTEKLLLSDPAGVYPDMDDTTKALYRKEISKKAKKLGKSEAEVAKEALTLAQKAFKQDAANKRECHIGTHLIGKPQGGKLYIACLLGITAAVWAGLTILSPLCAILLFPIWETVKTAVDFVFSKLCKPTPIPGIAPEKISKEAGVLVVITSLLCGEKSDKSLFDRLERLYLATSPTCPNSVFGILGDFPDSPTASTSSDRSTLEYASDRINALNRKYGEKFVLYVRDRRFSKSEKSFMGWERKRGAVIELVRNLKGKKTTFCTCPKSLGKEIRYVVTLDSDTNMPLGSLARLVGAMEHPLNRPVIDRQKGIVVSGYGIMQPLAMPEIASAGRTPFSRIMCGEGGVGIDIYSEARFDLYQTLFGEGIFCGKGIFDVDAFYETIDKGNPFPEDYILSHDSLESARLRCAVLTDVTFTDSFPKNSLSYLKRSHRWIRGDVQNLIFLLTHPRFPDGKAGNNRISALSRFKLFDNVRRALVPVMSFVAIVLAAVVAASAVFVSTESGFAADIVVLATNAVNAVVSAKDTGVLQIFGGICGLVTALAAALSPYAMPLVLDLFNCIFGLNTGGAGRRFYSKGVCAGLWQSLLRFLYLTCMLPKTAFVTAGAVFTSLWRMFISGSGLIEWQTAAQSDLGDGSLLDFIRKNFSCAVCGAAIFLICPVGIIRLVAFGWFLFPAIAFLSSFDRKRNHNPALSDEAITAFARDIWSFFDSHVTASESFLPPDNVSLFPGEKTAHRTSPTNIGLYLVALLCAADFGFIDAEALYNRLEDTVSVIEKMPKVRGHLFNWYATDRLAVLSPRFISTVDSGNFLSCLIALKEGLREYVSKKPELAGMILRIEKLISQTDLGVLYNKERELFSVGLTECSLQAAQAAKSRGKNVIFEAEKELSDISTASPNGVYYVLEDGCYDLFMSEARTTSYIAAALGVVPAKHWSKLSRSLISRDGYMGLASWTGTAFEYFMPCLFLPTFPRSMGYEALCFAYKCQRERKAYFPTANSTFISGFNSSDSLTSTKNEGIFGISESGFFGFDADMNYGYKAFGIPSLGLKRGLENDLVISPYSTFLFLALDRKEFSGCNTFPIAQNLELMKKHGLYGRHGFYEALDFTPSRIGAYSHGEKKHTAEPCTVKSFMSHHLGMSLAALCNARFGDVLCRRFMKDPRMNCARELLEEKIPVGAIVGKPVAKSPDESGKPKRESFRNESVSTIVTPNPLSPSSAILCCGNSSLYASSCGHLCLKHCGRLVFDYSSDTISLTRSLFAFTSIDGKIVSPSLFPVGNGMAKPHELYFKSDGTSIVYGAQINGNYVDNTLTLADGVVRAKLSVRLSSQDKSVTPKGAWFGIPVMENPGDHFAHPAFSFLSIEAEYLDNEKILIFSRRPRKQNDTNPCTYIAAALKAPNTPLSFDTRLGDIFCGEKNAVFQSDFSSISFSGKNNVGACVNPGMALYFDLSRSGESGAFEQELIVAFGKSRKEVLDAVRFHRTDEVMSDMHSVRNACGETMRRLCAAAGVGTGDSAGGALCAFETMLGAAFFARTQGFSEVESFEKDFSVLPFSKDLLWRHGISGDLPIVLVQLASGALLYACRDIVRAFRLLISMGMAIDLCFVFTDADSYSTPVKNAILTELSALGAFDCVRRKGGGIFLVSENTSSDAQGRLVTTALTAASCHIFEVNSGKPFLGRKSTISGELVPVIAKPGDAHSLNNENDGVIDVASGYFSGDDSFTVCKSAGLSAPYSHVLTGKNASCLVTQSSLGFTFVGNSSEKRLTSWTSRLESPGGERLFIMANGALYDLCAMATSVTYSPGLCVYKGSCEKVSFEITVYMCEKLRCKVCDVQVFAQDISDVPDGARLCLYVEPVMGKTDEDAKRVIANSTGSHVEFQGLFSESFGKTRGAVMGFALDGNSALPSSCACITDKRLIFTDINDVYTPKKQCGDCAAVVRNIALSRRDDSNLCMETRFVLGAYRTQRELEFITQNLSSGYKEKQKAIDFAKSLIPDISIESSKQDSTELKSVSALFNTWLPYQNAACRFFARCGYYQAGGAYGFRDQLQDCLCLMYSRPDLVRSHLLRCAARQFEEGDVLHWWHETSGSFPCKGVRSKCSDDYLWLVYVTAEYVKFTGDKGILKCEIPYLHAPPLEDGVDEAYISPTVSVIRESLFNHLKRAIDRSLVLMGAHGLPLIGSCDWSDGLGGVGKDGRGESVWMAMFLKLVTDRFVFICRLCKFNHNIYESFGKGLMKSVLATSIDPCGKYFVRGFYDDGSPLGASNRDECKIDLLPQSFYALCGSEVKHQSNPPEALPADFNAELCFDALCECYHKLFDPASRLTALFTPAFKDTAQNPGYIKGYVSGIRENGGQYTHSAVWAAKGMFAGARLFKDRTKSNAVMKMGQDIYISINPILRTSGYFGNEIAQNYLTEPYVLCGDVYTNSAHKGRGGWSWYSGAAGWYYTVMLCDILGISFEEISCETPAINLSLYKMPFGESFCKNIKITVQPKQGCVYNICFGTGKDVGVTVDGRKYGDVNADNIKIPVVKGYHSLVVTRHS